MQRPFGLLAARHLTMWPLQRSQSKAGSTTKLISWVAVAQVPVQACVTPFVCGATRRRTALPRMEIDADAFDAYLFRAREQALDMAWLRSSNHR